MIRITGTEPATGLTRDELWEGLVRKAEAPMRFVPAIAGCRIVERFAGGFVREVVLRGERLRERVTFERGRVVRFERLSGRARGAITNEVVRTREGALALRFTFSLEWEDAPAGSEEERARGDRMRRSYLSAIRTTLAESRRLARRAAA